MPRCAGFGVKLKTPALEMAGCTLKRCGLSFVTRKLTTWPASLAGPDEMLVAQPLTVWAGLACAKAMFAPFVKPGASFTEFTVRVNVLTTVDRAVWALMLIVAVP